MGAVVAVDARAKGRDVGPHEVEQALVARARRDERRQLIGRRAPAREAAEEVVEHRLVVLDEGLVDARGGPAQERAPVRRVAVRVDGDDEGPLVDGDADRLVDRRTVGGELVVVVALPGRAPAGEDAADVLVTRDERRRLEVEPLDDGDVALERLQRHQRLAERHAPACHRVGVEAKRALVVAVEESALVAVGREEDEQVARRRRLRHRGAVAQERREQRRARAEPLQEAAPREPRPEGAGAAHRSSR